MADFQTRNHDNPMSKMERLRPQIEALLYTKLKAGYGATLPLHQERRLQNQYAEYIREEAKVIEFYRATIAEQELMEFAISELKTYRPNL